MADVFISYARKDKARVAPLKAALDHLGVDAFFDLDGIDGGDRFPDVLDQTVKAARVVFGCWTPHALVREWVKIECAIAQSRETLVPLEFEAVNAIDVPAAFYQLHRVNLTDWQGETGHDGWLAAVRAMARKLKTPALLDRANAIAAVTEDFRHLTQTSGPEMAVLWQAWEALAAGSDRAALAELGDQAKGTAIAALVEGKLRDLDRPAALRLLTGSQAVGVPPLRGWRLARAVGFRAGAVAGLAAAAFGTYQFVDSRLKQAESLVAEQRQELDRVAAELKAFQEGGGGYKFRSRNAFLGEPFELGVADGFTRLPGARGAVNPLSIRGRYLSAFSGRVDLFSTFGIDTPQRAAAFLGQAAIETGFFRYISENVNYSADLLMKVFPTQFPDLETARRYARRPEAIANRVYANRLGNGDEASGDGWRFRGRGMFQLTGRTNYQQVSELLGLDLVASPDLLETDLEVSLAAAAVLWQAGGLNEYADQGDFAAVSRGVNRGDPNSRFAAHAEDERIAWTQAFLDAFDQENIAKLVDEQAANCACDEVEGP